MLESEAFDCLENKIQKLDKNTRIAILMHDFPDPDAMAGGVFCKEMLKGMGFGTANVLFGGRIDKQNKDFFIRLGINDNSRKNRPLHNIYHFNYDINLRNLPWIEPGFYDKFIFVDHSGAQYH